MSLPAHLPDEATDLLAPPEELLEEGLLHRRRDPVDDPAEVAPAPPAPPAPRGPEALRSQPARTAYPTSRSRTTTGRTGTTTGPRRGRGGRRRGPEGVSPRPGYIPGLDGLRAIAIVSVLLFHFLPTTLPGGYLGVDVFFVVSGFLITTLLLRDVARRGKLDLLNFWKRRARRLLPALVLVVITSVTAARMVGGDLLVGIGRQALGALTFTTNWLEIGAGASYFHSTSPILFINFWSLAVEEQFYLFWPLVLAVGLALTRTTRQRLYLVGGAGLASTVAMAVMWSPSEDATRVYYGTDTHLMGLMAGAALAVAWADPKHRAGLRSAVWRRWRWAAVLGALLVLGAQLRWMEEASALTFRGGFLLASLATVVLVAALLESDSLWRTTMELAPLRWIGERSYGIYLWHWPVLMIVGALFPYAVGTTRGWIVLGGALTLTLVLTELSLRLVERPVRQHGFRRSIRRATRWVVTPWEISRTPRIVGGVVALMVVLTAVGVATAPEKSQTQRQIEDVEERMGVAGAAGAGTSEVGGTGITAGQALGTAVAAGQDGDGTAAGEAEDDAGTDGAEADASGKDAADDAQDGEAEKDAAAEEDAAAENEKDGGEGEEKDEPADDAELPEGAVALNGSAYTADADGLLVPPGEEITAIGDSLVVTSADGLTYRFPGIAYEARSNRQWHDTLAVIEEAVAAGTVRDNVVLHLGTNAGVDEKALRAALEAFGPERNVVVMDLYVRSSFVDSSNETIAEVVAEHPNAVVGDWNGTISQQPQVLQSDQVHPDIDGMHVYAEVVARAFDELAGGAPED
ncbi:acyltransferase family protein [Ornithinimicrobium sp. W1679]|uniref:acyltransferase family protein n=1 Tax=Ornithinimicrobium sp. W1679 TaxID=3418770 RepID=UPI003CF510AB